MMKNIYLYTLVCFFLVGSINAQQTPGNKQTQDYTIVGATAHIGNGNVIENATVQFSNGKITYVGTSTNKKGIVIDATGKHVYPGFIVANSSLGLAEIDAVKATRDFDEIGTMNPHIRSIIAYNAESKVIESMRPNGVLIAQITPRGGGISGTSSVVQLDAWNWEDAAIKTDDAIHINWPSTVIHSGGWFGIVPKTSKPDKKYTERLEKIKSYIKDAATYLKGNKSPRNLPFEAMQGLFTGTQKLFIHVNGQREISDAVTITKELGVQNIVIVKGYEAEKVADLLVKNNISVVLERAHRLPNSDDEDYDLPFRSAKILTDKGILVGLGMEGEMERMNTRNIPFYAGTYAAYGLGKEKAVQLITKNNAKILGIDKQLGTLEVGKDATLFISKGDALDMRTNQLTQAFINGRKISLESHQTQLWKRYANKYKNQ